MKLALTADVLNGERMGFWKGPLPFPSSTETCPLGKLISATAMSGLPSPLKSATTAQSGPELGGATATDFMLPNVPFPLPSKTSTQLSSELVMRISRAPSPFRSAAKRELVIQAVGE